MTYSFHVFIPTIGKESIFNMLVLLKQQLTENDYLTIVFDGPDLPNIDEVKIFTKYFSCSVNIIVEPVNTGYWGHIIRNKYKNLAGDFIWHVDDDDVIPSNSMEIIRNHCVDKSKLYIFKMTDKDGKLLWKTQSITFCEISTQMGITPTHINDISTFEYYYGGDFNFYKKIEDAGVPIEYVDKVIYSYQKLVR